MVTGNLSGFFGDWRAFDNNPIEKVDKKADNRGEVTNKDTGWVIKTSRQVHKETKAHRGKTEQNAVKYLPYIDDITKKAVLFDTFVSDDKNENSMLFHTMYAYTDVFGYPALLKLRVEELYYYGDKNSGVLLRDYILQNIEEESVSESNRLSRPNQSKTNSSVNSISDLFDFVKTYDLEFKPKPVNEALINKAEGTPRIVYHYTDSDFWEFDTNKSGSNQGQTHGDGIYVSTSPTAFSYAGKNRMELYVNIRNPFEMQLTDEQATYILEKYASAKHDLDKFNGLYRNHAMEKLTSPTRVFDYLSEYATENKIKVSDILKDLKYDGVHDGSEWVAFDSSQLKSATDNIGTFNKAKNDIHFSERDYPVDPDVDNTVKNAYAKPNGKIHKLSDITSEQNKAINRLGNQTHNDLYRGKYEGGKHLFSDNAIKHIINEHGDFLREGLRAQLPMTLTDIARHLSATKANKKPSDVKPTKTKEGYPSILTSYEVNGYTLYAEEIKKTLSQNKPSDLIGHTMYKAPTLPTAAFYTTSVQTQPKRQSEVLCKYYMPNSTNLSMGNFVADANDNPAQLYFISKNGSAKQNARIAGLVALSYDSANFTDKSGQIAQGYVRCKKPFYITQDNRVFSNSETNVAQRIEQLKKQGYDCFIFDKTVGDNYMVAVVNKAQIIKDQPTRVFSERDSTTSNRSILANALEGVAQNNIEKNKLAEYKQKISQIEKEEQRLSEIQKQLFTKGAVDLAQRKDLQFEAKQIANRINTYDRQLLNLESTTALKNVLNREKALAMKRQKQKDNEYLKQYKEKVAKTTKELITRNQESRKKAIESREKTAKKRSNQLVRVTGLEPVRR